MQLEINMAQKTKDILMNKDDFNFNEDHKTKKDIVENNGHLLKYKCSHITNFTWGLFSFFASPSTLLYLASFNRAFLSTSNILSWIQEIEKQICLRYENKTSFWYLFRTDSGILAITFSSRSLALDTLFHTVADIDVVFLVYLTSFRSSIVGLLYFFDE